jgi:tetratricopeptide (TPR) repeat protein
VTRDELLASFRANYERRDWLKALQDCRSLIEMNGRDGIAWRCMSTVYLALNQIEDARETARRAVELEPADPLHRYALGLVAARAERHEEALQHFEKVVELAPHLAEGYLGLASTYSRLGDTANAVYAFSQAYRAAPGNAEVARAFGAELLRMGQLTKAEYYLRQATELKSDFAEAHIELGEVLRRLGEDRDAVAELLRGLRIRPRPDGLVSLSRIHLKYREPRKALPHLARALEMIPDYAPAHHVLGLCQAAEGRWSEAIPHFERAYAKDPDNEEYALDLASALISAGRDLDRAHRLASAVRLKHPANLRAMDVSGWCLHKQGRSVEAREELEKARAMLELKSFPDPADAEIYEHLAEVYAALKDGLMAREMYARAVEADPGRREQWQKRGEGVQ